MRLIVIEASVIETVYLFEDKEREQMQEVDEERRKQLRVRKNNFICNNYYLILYGTNK